MPTEPRAVVFDLDDTLHPRRRYVVSGLRAVAAHVAAVHGVDRARAAALLARGYRVARGRELQHLQQTLGLPAAELPGWLEVFRAHRPRLRLPRPAAAVLAQLRLDWRLGVVTNGLAEVQARKVAALDLATLVDVVVFATADDRPGKPEPWAFRDVCARLDVAPDRAVFVGDDVVADIAGAAAVGMKTIWLAPPERRGSGGVHADITVHSLADVPAAARRLLPSWWRPHAA
jgi:putative hydrolase of the HAD superfamily